MQINLLEQVGFRYLTSVISQSFVPVEMPLPEMDGFAALAGIKCQTFAAWAARRRKRAMAKVPAAAGDPMRWLEAAVDQANSPGGLILKLPGGARVEVSDEKQATLAAKLVRALARSC